MRADHYRSAEHCSAGCHDMDCGGKTPLWLHRGQFESHGKGWRAGKAELCLSSPQGTDLDSKVVERTLSLYERERETIYRAFNDLRSVVRSSRFPFRKGRGRGEGSLCNFATAQRRLYAAICQAFILLSFVLLGLAQSRAAQPEKIDFNHHIRPLLSDRCFTCHGPDEKARKGKLRLDTEEGAFRAAESNKWIIKRGAPDASELIHRITSTDPEEVMPPRDSNLTLSREEISLLKRWVDQGAQWKKHWSFIPLEEMTVPTVKNTKWARNNIDRFVLARLERERLKPAPETSRERWLRRVTLDLTGLPPALPDIDAFLADRSPAAFEKVVDRLLASPAYGERMAVEWLDVARYADTYGYQADRFNHLWPWRDWVISAFNRNVRINDFILWQIAGDLLPNATREQRLGTAFNRLHRQTNEGGSVDEEFRVEYNADRVHTLSGAFLGLTMECARCHDHKFDPISQKDYYRLFAFFNSTDESGLYSHFTDAIPSPTLLLYENDAQEEKHRALKQSIASKEAALARIDPRADSGYEAWRKEVKELPVAGLIGHYSFDHDVITNRSRNLVSTNHTAKLNDGPRMVRGKSGEALRFAGENSVTIEQFADFKRTDPFSLSLWIQIPEEQPEIVVLHHQQAGSDAGYQGYQFVLENGHATFALVHFWPGNAIQVRTRQKLPLNQWLQCGITYDGSSRASGVRLFVDGQPIETEIVKDQLFKDFANGQPLTLAARFRGRGFKDGLIDELKVFDRCLTPLEMKLASTIAAPEQKDFATEFVSKATPEDLSRYYLAHKHEAYAREAGELKQLRDEENKLVNGIREIMSMGDLPTPRPTYVLKRGEYDKRGDTVTPDTPQSILALDPQLPRNRLGLAKWLVDERNPLTSRVLVNRYWQLFFGRGLVVTAEDFGSQGALPTHPELLDWLAKHFIESGWDLKALHKLIVLSATYRQSSEASPDLRSRDPENRLLARGPSQRLSAEMLRDQALSASGLLVNKVGGPSVKPYQPEGVWEETAGSKYEPDKGEALHRRSLYTFWKRTAPHPMMTTFDAPERNNCTARRQPTSTPLQALVLLNDPQFVEAAQRISERTASESASKPEEQITFIFRSLTGRRPSSRELGVLRRLYNEQGASSPNATNKPPLTSLSAVATAVLNFDEAVIKR